MITIITVHIHFRPSNAGKNNYSMKLSKKQKIRIIILFYCLFYFMNLSHIHDAMLIQLINNQIIDKIN